MENQDMKGFILAILMIGLTLVFGIYLADTMHNNFLLTTAVTAVNETVTASDAGTGMAASLLADGSCGTITAVYNATANIAILAGNYTQINCVLVNTTSEYLNAWLVSYPYTFSNETSSSTASGTLVTSLAGGSAWVTILIVVGFAVIVLGMLSEGLGKAVSGAGTTGYTY